jgi:hypothetical protein
MFRLSCAQANQVNYKNLIFWQIKYQHGARGNVTCCLWINSCVVLSIVVFIDIDSTVACQISEFYCCYWFTFHKKVFVIVAPTGFVMRYVLLQAQPALLLRFNIVSFHSKVDYVSQCSVVVLWRNIVASHSVRGVLGANSIHRPTDMQLYNSRFTCNRSGQDCV